MKIIKFIPFKGLVNSQPFKRHESGKIIVRAYIVSDELPEGFPSSASALAEEWPDYIFDTMSVMQILDPEAESKVYVVNEAGSWVATDNAVALMV